MSTNIFEPVFGGGATGSDLPYDADAWDGNTDVPTKNVVRDKIESIVESIPVTTDLEVVTGETMYPAASKGDRFVTTTHAYLGGAEGVGLQVNFGDIFECIYTNAGGTYAEVGSYWSRIFNVINRDDGYRWVEMAENTVDERSDPGNSIGFLNGKFKVTENGVEKSLDLASPGPIGATTPSTGNFTSLSINGFGIPDRHVYGVRWDTVNDVMKGVVLVNGVLLEYDYQNFPIQEQMKRCVLAHTTGTFQYYLHPNDSNKKLNGTASVLTGADGNVMVQIPKFYYALFNDGNFMYALTSLGPFSYVKSDAATVTSVVHPLFYSGGSSTPSAYKYCSAYEGVLYRSDAYVDGDTTQTYSAGDKIRSVSGKLPLSYFNRAERRQAIDGAFYQYDYWMNEALILLYLTRYKNWNSQLMLPGYTEGSAWDITKRCKTGITNVLGDACGSIKYGVAGVNRCAFAHADTVVVANSFYGVENLFGHLYKWVDGINIQYIGAPLTEAKVYVCNAPYLFSDGTVTNYTALGIDLPLVTGYQKTLHPGTLLPSVADGGSSTTFIADYFYTSSAACWRALCAGGALSVGAFAGVAGRAADNVASNRDARIAGRAAA